MKKNLFIVATLLLALVVAGCKKEPEQTLTTAQEVSITDVKSSGAENSVQALKDKGKSGDDITNMISGELQKQMTNTEIQQALEKAFECITNLQTNPTNLNNRAITVNELSSEISTIEKEIQTFCNDLQQKGKAKISYSSEPGNISDLDKTGVISVDISKIKFSTNEVKLSEKEMQLKGSGDIEAAAKGKVDFTKANGLEDFIIKEAILTVGLDADGNIDYKMIAPTTPEGEGDYKLSGKLNTSFTANSVISFVLPYEGKKYGGKILSSASFKINCNLAEIKPILENEEANFKDLEKYFTLNISSDLYTDDGEKVCELTKITSMEDLEKYFPIQEE